MYTQIDAWLDRTFPLPRIFVDPGSVVTNNYWLAFITIEEEVPIHEIQSVPWQSVHDSAREARLYVERAISINGSDQIEEANDKKTILETLGPPPRIAVPIYVIVTRCAGLESVVYIGKTKTENRFAAGHVVALKLHDQRFANCEKLVFRCSVTLLWDHDRVLIEWMPPATAEDILDDIESHLIFWLKPEFNTQKKNTLVAKHKDVTIHIQHRLNQRSFLHDHMSK
jgi:hypothetical protein